jgi:hypothetical protein
MDTDVTISLLKSGLVPALSRFIGFKFGITETNRAEVTHASERESLESAIARGDIVVRELTDPDALTEFASLSKVLGPGEAAVIALASQTGEEVAMHDKAGRRIAKAKLSEGRVHRLEDLLVEGVRSGALLPEDADGAAKRLRTAGDYELEFVSIGIAVAVADSRFGLNRTQQNV